MTTEHLFAFALILCVGGFLSLVLFDLSVAKGDTLAKGSLGRWMKKWEFDVTALGGFSYRNLVLASFLGLFLEMLMIRWISSEIRIFAYFKNFVLIACYLGFGLGCYLCRRQMNLLPTIIPLIALAAVVQVPWSPLRRVIDSLTTALGIFSDHVWGIASAPLDISSVAILLYVAAIIVPLFSLLALVFVPIGQFVGWSLENAPDGITAYSVNVLASLGGILLYTLLCFMYQPPWVWLTVAGVTLVGLLWPVPRLRWTALLSFCAIAALASISTGRAVVRWSPYQKLTLTPVQLNNATIAYDIGTNDTWYQRILDFSPAFVSSHPDFFVGVPLEWNAYNLPYKFFPRPASVLVLGAGTGNDAAAALRNGSGRVTAVEIDPLILELGRQLHFEKPYDSPRVRMVLDDARSYIQNSQDRFDMIVFSLLDSHTTSSHFSNIRIDNYVYTLEAMQAAKQLLQPDGIFIVKFQVETPWIAGRLRTLLSTVFGQAPIQMLAAVSHSSSGHFFISGAEQRVQQLMSEAPFAAYVRQHGHFRTADAVLTTDDWPYFYQHKRGIPVSVIFVSAVLLVVSWLGLNRTCRAGHSMRWHFFFLGAAFLLLEVQIISKVALLFGTTWLVNSIVISGLLLIIVSSNLVVRLLKRVPVRWVYAGIFLTIAFSYWIPTHVFLFQSVWLKGITATGVLCLPVFFAGIIFIQSFAEARFSAEALGSNLMGALVGGLLESLSFWTGLKSLLIIAALLYLASYLSLGRRVLGEQTARSAT
jgi:spermidine synthase